MLAWSKKISPGSYGEKVCSLHVNPEVGKKNEKNILSFNGCRGAKKKVLPGIEPGFRDSESPVITVTLQDLMVLSEPCVGFAPSALLECQNEKQKL